MNIVISFQPCGILILDLGKYKEPDLLSVQTAMNVQLDQMFSVFLISWEDKCQAGKIELSSQIFLIMKHKYSDISTNKTQVQIFLLLKYMYPHISTNKTQVF